MAKHTVLMSCGHEDTVELFGRLSTASKANKVIKNHIRRIDNDGF